MQTRRESELRTAVSKRREEKKLNADFVFDKKKGYPSVCVQMADNVPPK